MELPQHGCSHRGDGRGRAPSQDPADAERPEPGAIGGLRDNDVVEVMWLADEHGAHPIAQGRMPEQALALIEQVKVFERLTVAAAVERSYDAALGALLTHPLVPSYPVGKAILDEYVEALPGLLPPLQ